MTFLRLSLKAPTHTTHTIQTHNNTNAHTHQTHSAEDLQAAHLKVEPVLEGASAAAAAASDSHALVVARVSGLPLRPVDFCPARPRALQ